MQILKSLTLCAALVGWMGFTGSLQAQERLGIDPKADRLLQDLSDYLAESQQFTFQAEIIVDEFSPRGQKIQYANTINAAVRRPDGLRVNQEGDLLNRSFWFDGNSLSILERPLNHYASLDSPNDIDGALDYIYERFGVSAPLADLVVSDPYRSAIANVRTGDYLGLHQVRDRQCHHLAFTQAEIDWQIWIEESDRLVPCKLVITYKTLPDSPQYMAYFSDWNFDVRLPDRIFRFEIPEDAIEIELRSRE